MADKVYKLVSKVSFVIVVCVTLYCSYMGLNTVFDIWFGGLETLPYIDWQLSFISDSALMEMYGIFYWGLAGIVALVLEMLPAFFSICIFGYCKYKRLI